MPGTGAARPFHTYYQWMSLFRRKPQGVPVDISAGDPNAARLVDAIGSEDLAALRKAFEAAQSPEERERLTVVTTEVPGHPDVFEAWVQEEPERALAWLARGAYGVSEAWEVRGAGYGETVEEEAWEVFHDRLLGAEDDLMRAADLDPQDPVPWTHLVTSGRGLQVPKEELWLRFEEARRRRPWLPEAHMALLQGICEKWSGSHEEALAFARETSRDAPAGAPVHAVLPMAHLEVWLSKGSDDEADAKRYSADADVREEIQEAARRSVLAPEFVADGVSMYALNVFACGLYTFGDEPGAAALAQRIGQRRAEFPWVYYDDADRLFGALLAG